MLLFSFVLISWKIIETIVIKFLQLISSVPCHGNLNIFFHLSSIDTGKRISGEQKEEQKAEKETVGCSGTAIKTNDPLSGEEQAPCSGCSTAQEASAPQVFMTAALSTLERPKALSQILERPPLPPTFQKKSLGTAPTAAQTLEQLLVSSPPQEKTLSTISTASESLENPKVSPLSHKKKSPSTVPATVELRNSTQ